MRPLVEKHLTDTRHGLAEGARVQESALASGLLPACDRGVSIMCGLQPLFLGRVLTAF